MVAQQMVKEKIEEITHEIHLAYSTGERINRFRQGLCSTCIHRRNCTLTASKPVQWCDEFCEGPSKCKEKPKFIQNKYSTEENTKETVFQGLCVNCEHRFDCTSSKTEGGIWYCEEYC